MFFQSQAFPTGKQPEKARFCLAFFDFQKKPKVFKKARILKSGFKKATLATLIMAVRTSAAFKLSLFPDNDLSYSIPHTVKCRTGAVNNLSRSGETCTMLKIILLKLKFIKNLRISDTTSNYVSASIWLCLPSNMKSSSQFTQNVTTSLSFLKSLQIQNLKRKIWGDKAYYIPTVQRKWGARPSCPQPNFAHQATCSTQHN